MDMKNESEHDKQEVVSQNSARVLFGRKVVHCVRTQLSTAACILYEYVVKGTLAPAMVFTFTTFSCFFRVPFRESTSFSEVLLPERTRSVDALFSTASLVLTTDLGAAYYTDLPYPTT